MIETNCSNGDSSGASGREPETKRRVTVFVLLLALTIGLVAFVEANTWRQLDRLRNDFAGANLESFYLGVHLRETVLRMNGALFRFQLSEDAEERERFESDARQLTDRIEQTRSQLTTDAERQLLGEIGKTYERYLTNSAPLLERGLRGIRKDTAAKVHDELSAKAEPLLALADKLVQAQHVALNRFFASSGAALGTLQTMLVVSLILFVALVGSAAALMYRAFVAPLRVQLSQSQAIIERQEKLASLGVLAAWPTKSAIHSLRSSSGSSALRRRCPSQPDMKPVTVEGLLEEVRDLLRSELEQKSIQLKLDVGEAALVRADRQQLQQVLINLVQNAADSIGNNGAITLRSRNGEASTLKSAQPAVMIEVADTGKGIPPEVEKRIFDPFFSTKEGGTGLGLSIASRIVEKHGGFIQYLTQLNQGTTFSLVLPKVTSDESANPAH